MHLAALVLHLPSCWSLGRYSVALLYILTAGGESDLLHSLHRCRNLQCRSQEASWKLLGMRQPRRPEMGDGTSRSPSHPLPTQPDTAVYPDRWKQASTSDHYFRLLTSNYLIHHDRIQNKVSPEATRGLLASMNSKLSSLTSPLKCPQRPS